MVMTATSVGKSAGCDRDNLPLSLAARQTFLVKRRRQTWTADTTIHHSSQTTVCRLLSAVFRLPKNKSAAVGAAALFSREEFFVFQEAVA